MWVIFNWEIYEDNENKNIIEGKKILKSILFLNIVNFTRTNVYCASAICQALFSAPGAQRPTPIVPFSYSLHQSFKLFYKRGGYLFSSYHICTRLETKMNKKGTGDKTHILTIHVSYTRHML